MRDENAGCRGYVDTILTSLKSHMDVQSSDGKAMLLKYVTSYVTKLKDHEILDIYHGSDISGYHIGARYMERLIVGVPEMVQHFCTTKVAWCMGE